jgi:hypothetical protein
MIHPIRIGCVSIASLALCVISASAIAQTTYKCGNSYSETPCVDGKAVTTEDKRTDSQKSQADETNIRQRKAANKFEKDRIAQEKRDAKALRDAGPATIIGKPGPEVRKQSKATQIKVPKPIKAPKAAKPAKVSKKKPAEKPAKKKA